MAQYKKQIVKFAKIDTEPTVFVLDIVVGKWYQRDGGFTVVRKFPTIAQLETDSTFLALQFILDGFIAHLLSKYASAVEEEVR